MFLDEAWYKMWQHGHVIAPVTIAADSNHLGMQVLRCSVNYMKDLLV